MEQILAQFREFLHGRALRATDVRDAIVRAIVAREGHFDVDEIVGDLQARGVAVSRATVYRSLPLLREAGIVQATVPTERGRYEAAAGHAHHDHLVCTACGAIVEFQFEAFEILQREVAARHGFRLTGHSHQLYGLCAACQPAAAAR